MDRDRCPPSVWVSDRFLESSPIKSPSPVQIKVGCKSRDECVTALRVSCSFSDRRRYPFVAPSTCTRWLSSPPLVAPRSASPPAVRCPPPRAAPGPSPRRRRGLHRRDQGHRRPPRGEAHLRGRPHRDRVPLRRRRHLLHKPDGRDVLYVRPDAKFDKSKPISGGLHCWPQFGPGDIQVHGFARTSTGSSPRRPRAPTRPSR